MIALSSREAVPSVTPFSYENTDFKSNLLLPSVTFHLRPVLQIFLAGVCAITQGGLRRACTQTPLHSGGPGLPIESPSSQKRDPEASPCSSKAIMSPNGFRRLLTNTLKSVSATWWAVSFPSYLIKISEHNSNFNVTKKT